MNSLNKTNPGLYLITGVPGVGKTTIGRELKALGFKSADTDDPNMTIHINLETGHPTLDRTNEDIMSEAWQNAHEYRWNTVELKKLRNQARDEPIFFTAFTPRTIDEETLSLFSKIFILKANDTTLIKRINTRTDNVFGKGEGQMQKIIDWNAQDSKFDPKYKVAFIDANGEVENTLQKILGRL